MYTPVQCQSKALRHYIPLTGIHSPSDQTKDKRGACGWNFKFLGNGDTTEVPEVHFAFE